MENRKTAEEILREVYTEFTSTDNESGKWADWDEADKSVAMSVSAMHTFAEQEAVEFAEWKEENYYVWSRVNRVWIVDPDYTLSDPKPYTTTQLYQIFKSERDGK